MALDVERYLARIGLTEAPPIDVGGLETLQRAHLTSVPFENLDVFARRGVRTDLEWSVPKVVERQRGGWCFELNGAFGGLLDALGFQVEQWPAVVLPSPGADEPTHLVLVVRLGSAAYLVDVGFGDSFIRPLRLDTEARQDGGSGWFQIIGDGRTRTLSVLGAGDTLSPQYRTGPNQWSLSEFNQASERLQTDHTLKWTKSRFATRLIDGGPDRVTLLEDRIRFRRDGAWIEEPIGDEEWASALNQWFGLTL